MRETQRQPNLPELTRPAQSVQPAAPVTAGDATQSPDKALRFQVSTIVFQGATLIAADQLQNIVKGWLNREITITDLRAAAQAVTDEYQRLGWYARAQVPAQEIRGGQVRIDVIEGRLGVVQVDDGGLKLRMDKGLVTGIMTARQKPGDPLRLENIERAIGILGDTPGVAVKAVLAPGAAYGETDVVIGAKDKPLLAAIVSLDDHGARSTGVDRFSANFSLDNPSGRGDQANLSTVLGEGHQYLRLAYTQALGNDGLRVGANAHKR